jgi:hypothetical protein
VAGVAWSHVAVVGGMGWIEIVVVVCDCMHVLQGPPGTCSDEGQDTFWYVPEGFRSFVVLLIGMHSYGGAGTERDA